MENSLCLSRRARRIRSQSIIMNSVLITTFDATNDSVGLLVLQKEGLLQH
jgi:hypothetical protein